jgi:hypothetical protein
MEGHTDRDLSQEEPKVRLTDEESIWSDLNPYHNLMSILKSEYFLGGYLLRIEPMEDVSRSVVEGSEF